MTIDPRLSAIKDCLYRVAVRAVIIENGRLLIVREPDGLYGLPGGGLDYGEDCLTALKRELHEELSIPPSSITIQSQALFITNIAVVHGLPRLNIFFRATLANTPKEGSELEFQWISASELGNPGELHLGPSTYSKRTELAQLMRG